MSLRRSLQRRQKQAQQKWLEKRDKPLSPSQTTLFKTLAGQIADDAEFKRMLETVAPDRREICYDQISQCLKFKCLPFAQLFPSKIQ